MMLEVGEVIAQGARAHSMHRLGSGRSRIGRSGCLLCALVQAARAMVPKHRTLSVLDAHALIEAAGGFAGSALWARHVRDDAARALGLSVTGEIVLRPGLDDELAHATLHLSLSAGQGVIVGIDHRDGASSGASDADHFALAVDVAHDAVTFADPGLASFVSLRLDGAGRYRGKPARISELRTLAALEG
jgi:hypothetical protein